MNSFFRKLNEPFPDKSTFRENIFDVIGIGIFITLFLYFLSPMDMDTYPDSVFLLCCGYGLVTILVALVYDFVSLKIIKVERDLPSWTFKKWIFHVIGLLTCITIANYIFTAYISNGMTFNIPIFFQIILSTWIIGFFPVVFSGTVIQLRNYKANQVHAANISDSLPSQVSPTENLVSIFSQNKKNKFEINVSALLFAEAMQNYVAIYYLKPVHQKDGENKVQKEIIRATLSNVEKQLSDTPIIRCHRSYLVNPNQIQKVEGNAQGLRLTLHQLENTQIPVSRKYIPALKEYRS